MSRFSRSFRSPDYRPRTPSEPPKPSELSIRFCVDDVSGAIPVGSRLNNILAAIAAGKPVHPDHKTFLRDRGARALVDFMDGVISEAKYTQLAPVEREIRREAARQREAEVAIAKRIEAERRAEEAALADKHDAAMRAKREAEREAARIQRENSPAFIAKRNNQQLLRKYGVVEYLAPEHFKRILLIVRTIEAGERLDRKDVIWLKATTHEYEYGFKGVLHAHHRHEANVCITEFQRSGDPWQAVTASGHLRKCNASQEVIGLLAEIPAQRLKQPKLKSAMLTTQGGAMRDLERFSEAQRMGEEAHLLLPQDFRPCTLLGAIHIQQGNYSLGHEWYRKAEERGASRAGNDAEIRALLRGMPEDEQKKAVTELLRIDAFRYSWLKKKY